MPSAAAEVGQWVGIMPGGTGAAYVLPAGGTWVGILFRHESGTGTLYYNRAFGPTAGGTQLAPGSSGKSFFGFAWRIA